MTTRAASDAGPRRAGLVIVLTLTLVVALGVGYQWLTTDSTHAPSAAPPRASGFFELVPPGTWSSLPDDELCRDRVHRSTWEPRPQNTPYNRTVPSAAAVHRSFAVRPRDTSDGYDPRWDTWLLPRVDGQFMGTTDEVLQWAACKWGLPDNLLRAVAAQESTWNQYATYPSGRCVLNAGCGDLLTDANRSTTRFCTGLARFGHDYQQDYGPGLCPRTFSIMGIMAWQAPDWGHMRRNQNGTFPFSRDSTAFAVDYYGAYLRGCLEGWEFWLASTGTHDYRRGNLWGCVGSWYSGGWFDSAAEEYISHVKTQLRHRVWLRVGWPLSRPLCSPEFGCPRRGLGA